MKSALFKILLCIIAFNTYLTSAYAQLLPIPDWAKAIGGTGESKTSGLVVDKHDNVYVSGNFQGILSFGSGPSMVKLTSVGNYDVFIAKYTYDGQFLWATRFGGTNLDQTNTLAVDLNGNAYLACMTQSPSINSAPRQGVYNFNGIGQEALLVKIDADGEFQWARSIGGSGNDAGHMASTDKEGNVIFVGYCSSNNVNLDGWIINSKGGKDGFIVKFNPNGNVLWAYTISTPNDEEVAGIRVNSNNEIAVTGYITSLTNLNPKGPPSQLNATSTNYFLAKYSKDFDLLWVNSIVGPNNQSGGLAMNGSDEMYVNGTFTGTVSFGSTITGNSTSLNSIGVKDLYITKYSVNGDVQWTRRMIGTSPTMLSYNIVADVDDNVYISGYFGGTLEFGDSPDNKVLSAHGYQDTFFGKYDAQGNYIWSFNFGSSCSGNYGHKITVDSKKNVILGGRFCKTIDFNPGNCELNLTAQHSVSDAFVVKYNQVKLTGEPIVTSFILAEQTENAKIDVENKTIKISVHPGTDLTRLKPDIMVDIGLTNPLSNTEQDFSSPRTYTISSNCIDYPWTVKVSLAPNQQTEICALIPFLVSGETDVPGSTFQWEILQDNETWINAPQTSNSADYQSPGIENDTDQNIIIKFRRKVISNGIESYDSEIDITIYPSISNNTISADQTLFCNGKADITITGSTPINTGNPLAYRWQQSLNGIDWTDIQNAIEKDLSVPEFYQTTWFRRIITIGQCDAYSTALKIVVYDKVTISNAGIDISVCETPAISLNANTVGSNEAGTWSVISPLDYQPFSPSDINNPNASINNLPANQEVILKWTITNTICNTSSSDLVTIVNYQLPANTISANQTLFCDGKADITITGSTPINIGNPLTYRWQQSLNGIDWTDIQNAIEKDLSVPEFYQTTWFRRIITIGQCDAYSTALKIVVYDKVTISNAGIDISVCETSAISLNANTVGPNETGIWSVISPLNYQPFSPSDINNPNASINNLPANQEVILKWTITNTICNTSSSDLVKVINYESPTVVIPEKIVINYGETFNLNVIVNPHTTPLPYTFLWSPSTGLTNPHTLSPKVSPLESTVYHLTIFYGLSCHKTYQTTIHVTKDLIMPNAFSPNMDGINDQWVIKNIETQPKSEVYIYNRYGTRVFYSNHYSPWDGTYKGNPVPVGTYYYIIKLNNSTLTTLKGSITVIR